jgi:phage terminase large subunit GpA-like protein
MREFAEQEIVIPAGPYAGRRFRCSRQPYTALWFDAVDSGRWCRCVATGPTQSGKTLSCFVIPLLYHLFEIGETVVCGLPDMDMAADKWREDLLPAIESSRYRDLLPRHGGGSRGGRVESFQFNNGATLKFMSGGGSDKSRAGFTTRTIVITETDGMDRSGGTSRESDKITQLEARTRAFGRRKRIYMECTVSTEQGRTWQEYESSTRSRIVLPCPHCSHWVSPEREHLLGWQEALSQAAARDAGAFICPKCRQLWNEDDRLKANQRAKLLHAGQAIDAAGDIQGEVTDVDTLGFRWSGVHNLFLTPGDLAADEWRAVRAADEENAEREMRQYVWCVPIVSSREDAISLEIADIMARAVGMPRGIVPQQARWLTSGLDIGKFLVHWVVVAWHEDATSQILDYGRIETACDDLGVEHAVLTALRQFRDTTANGWPIGIAEGQKTKTLDFAWVDAGYLPEVVHAFCRETGTPFHPAVGRGGTQPRRLGFARPAPGQSEVQQIGEGFHVCWLPAEGLHRVDVDADHWKSWVHQRLHTPIGQPGAMTLFRAAAFEHMSLARHLTAEHKVESYVAGKGVVVQWERLRRQNHWLDALYNASAAASQCGARLVGRSSPESAPEPAPRQQDVFRTPDGRPWFVLAR